MSFSLVPLSPPIRFSIHRCSVAVLSLFTQEPHFPYNFDHNDEDLPQEAIRICVTEQRVVLATPIMISYPYVLVC